MTGYKPTITVRGSAAIGKTEAGLTWPFGEDTYVPPSYERVVAEITEREMALDAALSSRWLTGWRNA